MAEKLVPLKKVKNAVLYKSGHIKVSNVRASYPHLAEPYSGGTNDDGAPSKPKYSITALIPKDTHAAAIQLIKDQIEAAKKAHKGGPLRCAPSNLFLKDGDEHYPDKPECEGMYVLSAREDRQPTILNMDREELTSKNEIEEEFYGGCYVSIVIRPWTQENGYGKRVNANLSSVLKRKDGEPFGEARVDTSDAYDDDDDNEWGDDDEV